MDKKEIQTKLEASQAETERLQKLLEQPEFEVGELLEFWDCERPKYPYISQFHSGSMGKFRAMNVHGGACDYWEHARKLKVPTRWITDLTDYPTGRGLVVVRYRHGDCFLRSAEDVDWVDHAIEAYTIIDRYEA